jgi:hypothetical protein
LREQNLGNSIATYSEWSHIKAENGYSIWKFMPTDYVHDDTNSIYLDGKELINKGLATSETATTYDTVFTLHDVSGASYVDVTTEAGTEAAPVFPMLETITSYIYLGNASKFYGTKFEFYTRGSGLTLVVEYWNGSAWTAMTVNDNTLTDNTNNLTGDGSITWDSASVSTWDTTAVNSVTKYWVRISTTTAPVTAPEVYYVIPSASVISLLALSSNEIFNETWAFCSFTDSIYVTIRNAGAALYEGDFYITSSSSSLNLENFFVHNHSFTGDYVNVNY